MVMRPHKYADGGKVMKRVQRTLDKVFGHPQMPTTPAKKPVPKTAPGGAKEKFE